MRASLLALSLFAVACSGAPTPVQRPAAALAPAPVPTAQPTATVTAEPVPSPAPSATASLPPAPEGPSACPVGMKLVDGDYCSEVEHACLKSWFDKSNKKLVCEDFAPNKATCVGTKAHKRYCIDEYSWPNQKGVRPEVMNYFWQAEVKCAAVGKRMCTESEWTLACEGPEMTPFPYGYKRDPTKCNGDRPWDQPNMKKVARRDPTELARLWQGVPSGSQPECVSAFGVADLPGNTDEVVASETFTGHRSKFDSVHTGGPWYKGVRNQCRPKIYTHNEEFYYYFLSFRCCAEPDAAPTDPRTPKQVKAGWPMKKVESLARFTAAQMREKLELKKQGLCTCKDKDIRCKTMCGTLLGPSAKDVR